MKKILVFAGSNKSSSINHQLVVFAASQVVGHHVEVIKLTDYPLPLFGEDIEKAEGYSVNLRMLLNKIKEADALIISVNEHNRMISSFFKNILDWLSRLELRFFDGKKILLMSTSDGRKGAAAALEYAKFIVPRYGGIVVESFSIPSFYENFSAETQSFSNEVLHLGIVDVIQNFVHQLQQ